MVEEYIMKRYRSAILVQSRWRARKQYRRFQQILREVKRQREKAFGSAREVGGVIKRKKDRE